jgi:hypothetical protein
MVYVDVMVVHDPLDFNLLLGRDYVYIMRYFVSTLFRVICFHHNGNIVMIDQLSFIDPHLIVNHLSSMNGPYMPTMSSPPQVIYVKTRPMRSTPHKRESLPYPNLDSVVDMVISSIGLLESDSPTLIEIVDMYSFRSVFLPSNKGLMEAMVDVCPLTCIPSRALSSWKPLSSRGLEHSFASLWKDR